MKNLKKTLLITTAAVFAAGTLDAMARGGGCKDAIEACCSDWAATGSFSQTQANIARDNHLGCGGGTALDVKSNLGTFNAITTQFTLDEMETQICENVGSGTTLTVDVTNGSTSTCP